MRNDLKGAVGAGLLLSLLGCSDYSYSQKTRTDVFQQLRRNTVDVLMVVDSSCSMFEEQDRLAANFSSFITAFDGVDVDWQMSVVTTDMVDAAHQGRFVGGDDEIELRDAEGRVIDRVAYDLSWGLSAGVAHQLSPDHLGATDNDVAEHWCAAASPFGAGDLGSPGEANPACGSAGPLPPPDTGSGDGGDGGSTGDLRVPVAGEVLITEFLADPAAADDALGEWIELHNPTADRLDLSGFRLTDAGRNLAELPADTVIEPGAWLVVGRDLDPANTGGAPVSVAVPTGFTLNNAVRVLTSSTPGAAEIFSEMVAVGVAGSGIEMGLDAARAALSPDLLAGHNAGFLRDAANLSVIFISDENDYSTDATNDYYDHFVALKGDEAYRDHGIVNFSAVVGKDAPPYDGQPSCESGNGVAAYGARYVDLAARTDGALESICDEDFSPIAEELGLLVSGLELTFVLTELCNEDTLIVSLYGDSTDESFIRELEKDVDYSFDAVQNALVFRADQVPPSESYIVADYQVLARSSDRTSESTEVTE